MRSPLSLSYDPACFFLSGAVYDFGRALHRRASISCNGRLFPRELQSLRQIKRAYDISVTAAFVIEKGDGVFYLSASEGADQCLGSPF